MPVNRLSKVLFPVPLAPMRETKSRSSMVRSTALRGRIFSSPLENSLVSLRISTSAMFRFSEESYFLGTFAGGADVAGGLVAVPGP